MARTIIHGKIGRSSDGPNDANNHSNHSNNNNNHNDSRSHGHRFGHDPDNNIIDPNKTVTNGTTATATTDVSRRCSMEGDDNDVGKSKQFMDDDQRNPDSKADVDDEDNGGTASRKMNHLGVAGVLHHHLHNHHDPCATVHNDSRPRLLFGGVDTISFPSFRSLAGVSSSVAVAASSLAVAAASSKKSSSASAATATVSATSTKTNYDDNDSSFMAPPHTKKIKMENLHNEDDGFENSTDDDEINGLGDDAADAADDDAASSSRDILHLKNKSPTVGREETKRKNDSRDTQTDDHQNVLVKQEDDDRGLAGAGEYDIEDAEGELVNNTNDADDDDDDDDEDSVDSILREDYEISDGKLAFCCQNCKCLDTKNVHRQYFQIRNNCGNSSGDGGLGNTKLFHRGCCHGHKIVTEDFISPMQEAMEKGADGKLKKKQLLGFTQTQLKKMYTTAMRDEAQFERLKVPRQSPLRVLDLFSGIGSGTVVLKRLKLPISLIIHVEHDPIAVAVCKYNHKNDNIEHVYVESFEDIYGKTDEIDNDLVASFMKEHGPIDLVLSAAPCQNYSGLNARRDQSSYNAQYLLKVGRLIHKLDDIQMSSMGVKDNVLFLSENVVFKNHDEVDKSYAKVEGEALTPVCVDAKDFSPCKRKRFYWVNVPIKSSDRIKEVAAFESVDKALDNGYGAIARLLMKGDMNTQVKANTFLASSSKIDDNRMLKLKIVADSHQPQNRYYCETYSISERERMMGLPIGYVQLPLSELFSQLTSHAFVQPETSAEGKTYRDFLTKSLWHLRRTCKFKFHPCVEPPFFQLALSSPLEGKNDFSFFTEEEYGKHLIGNGWSIPVVEHLLGKLRELFAEDVLVTYHGYDKSHPWEPYLSI